MHYYLYEVRNNLNGKIYVGVHKSKSLDDGYMGSGKIIQHAIKKHGVENFTKVILEIFDDSISMYAREKEVVTAEFLSRDDVYNLRRGGLGGWDHLNDGSEAQKQRIFNAGIKSQEIMRKNKIGVHSDDWVSPWVYNKDLQRLGVTPESRRKAVISQKITYEIIGHQKGESNSQFGMMWITDGVNNRKIKKFDPIPIGWIKGRNMRG
jgi:hypothetical protein